MARPMCLIKKPLLEEIALKHYEGVPITRLIRKYHLPLTPPTLTKLVNYFLLAQDSSKSQAAKDLIYASLFPEWLLTEAGSVHTQPPNWHYNGRMPLGEWVYKEFPTE